jgi:hypothetical protein
MSVWSAEETSNNSNYSMDLVCAVRVTISVSHNNNALRNSESYPSIRLLREINL